ncbi:hypothetical protein BB560_005384 [Smittium megazygosporum]|uniref:Uncharacterized protein n=1 Tax=Smittium megazygosporum TaxID=133381 RepID=A0A2T9Z6M1_9FUNG|nr:hypothetical protein BB560_005384 [Smittium megazygosporum]
MSVKVPSSSYSIELTETGNCFANCALNLGPQAYTSYNVSDFSSSALENVLACLDIEQYKSIVLCSSNPDFEVCNSTNSNPSPNSFAYLNSTTSASKSHSTSIIRSNNLNFKVCALMHNTTPPIPLASLFLFS